MKINGPVKLAEGMRGIGNQPVDGVQDATGQALANCGTAGPYSRAIAQKIVQALNMHAPMLDALNVAQHLIETPGDFTDEERVQSMKDISLIIETCHPPA